MSAENRLQSAVLRLLAPLVRLLLRHGVGHGEFADWAKQVYVDEAAEHFGVPGRKTSVSRIAIVTGIHRKEVKRVLERNRAPDEAGAPMARYNRAMRVTHGWLNDPEFLANSGEPRVLQYGDAEASFNRLVKAWAGDVPARALLDELEASGTVSREGDRIRLMTPGYIPHQSADDLLEIYGLSASDLLSTLEHNLADPAQARLQMTVAYDNLSTASLKTIRQLSEREGMALLRSLDRELARMDRDNPAYAGNDEDLQDPKRYRAGLGLYLIEQDLGDEDRGNEND